MDKTFISLGRARLSEVPTSVKVLAVTKQRSVAEIVHMVGQHETLLRHGNRYGNRGLPLLSFGENRVEGIEPRILELRAALPHFDLEFHFLGKLQSRKIATVAAAFDVVQSVENLEQATQLNQAARGRRQPLPFFLEVNLTQQIGRSGTSFQDLAILHSASSQFPHLQLVGLMGMAGLHADLSTLQSEFSALAAAKEKFHLQECSMGMSEDYETALTCGSTWLRLGRILFEEESALKA